MNEQATNLKRVSDRIAPSILSFFEHRKNQSAFLRQVPTFHADELRVYVEKHCGTIAPGSTDRVLRQLRAAGKLDYVVLSRRESLYEIKLGKVSSCT